MAGRSWVVSGWLAAVALSGCSGPAPHRGAAALPDPDRWERAACQLGEYPPEMDAGALARAHLEDVRARGRGDFSPFAAARLEDERAAFRARCERWQRQARLGEGSPP